MVRLALISTNVQSQKQELGSCCARLRGVELTATGRTWEEISQNPVESFDAVILATIENWMEVALRCAQERKHVLLSGSVLQTVHDVDQLVTEFREANVCLMVGGTIRFQPSINAVSVAAKSGRLGLPALLRSHAWYPKKGDSRFDTKTVLFQQLDLTQWIFGKLPTEIYAVRHCIHEDTSQIHFGFPGGAMGLVTISGSLPDGDRYCSCSVISSTGAAYADDHRQMQLVYQQEGVRADRTEEESLAQVEELREFAGAITQNREPSVSIADARRVMIMMEAVSRSIELRQPLRLEGGSYVSVS